MNDLSGKTFGRLSVVRRAASNRNGSSTWECVCLCGNTKVLSSDHLTRKNGPVKSCGCLRKEHVGENHHQWNGFGGISGGWWYDHVEKERQQRKRVPVSVTITKEYAWELYERQGRVCALSGIPIAISSTQHLNTASIDRIDSSKGYEEGNIQWVHKHVNFMKRTYSQEYFINMCINIANFAGGKCEI